MSGIMLERTFLRTQYDACIVRGQSVILQKQRLVAKYALIEAKYLHDTRQKVGASSLIADKRKVLAGQEERLSKKSQRRSARSAAPADLRRFSAYLPLHVASEQKRIVDSYRDP